MSARLEISGSSSMGRKPYAARSRSIIRSTSWRSVMRVSSCAPPPCARGAPAMRTRMMAAVSRFMSARKTQIVLTLFAAAGPGRELDRDAQAGTEVFRRNRPPMLLDGLPGNGQAEPGTGGLRREVRIEDLGEYLGRYAGPVVLDGNHDLGVDATAVQANAAARRGLKRILDQVRDRSPEQPRIADELPGRGRID